MAKRGIEDDTGSALRTWRRGELDEIACVSGRDMRNNQAFSVALTHPNQVAFTASLFSPCPQSGLYAGINSDILEGILG